MNKITIKLLGRVLLSMALFGCDRSDSFYYSGLLEEASIELEAERYMLIVPQNGCSTCAKKSYDFILKNQTNPSIKYVFTHYASKKAVKVRLTVLGNKNASNLGFIDLPVAREYGISTFYPTLLELGPKGEAKATLMNAEDMSD
jgi:hypothetical protein